MTLTVSELIVVSGLAGLFAHQMSVLIVNTSLFRPYRALCLRWNELGNSTQKFIADGMNCALCRNTRFALYGSLLMLLALQPPIIQYALLPVLMILGGLFSLAFAHTYPTIIQGQGCAGNIAKNKYAEDRIAAGLKPIEQKSCSMPPKPPIPKTTVESTL